MINLTQLKLFADIAHELSFVKVAEKNHISQPAVSVHIKKLEHSLGKPLLTRSPHNIQLTPEGIMILEDVEKILNLCHNLESRINYTQDSLEGNIRIAAIHSVGMYEFGDFLSSFIQAYPKVNIDMEFRRSDEIYTLLLKKHIDLGIVAYADKRTQIKMHALGNDELVLIVGKNHRFSRKKSIRLEEINNEGFIAFSKGIPTREAIDKVFDNHKISVSIKMTNDNIYTLKRAVTAGIGISIVPSRSVNEEVLDDVISRIKIRDIELLRPLSLIMLENEVPGPPIKAFIEQLSSSTWY